MKAGTSDHSNRFHTVNIKKIAAGATGVLNPDLVLQVVSLVN